MRIQTPVRRRYPPWARSSRKKKGSESMTEVFYFSSTGNSLYAAKRIADELEGRLRYIPKYEGGDTEADRVVIVSPEYALGLPVPTVDFIRRLKTHAPVYIVLTYGGAVMGADRAAYDEAKEAGLDIKAVFTLKMVESFTVFLSVPKFYIKKTMKKAPSKLGEIISRIREGAAFEPKKRRGGRRDSEKMREGWRQMGAKLWASDACVKCGKCVSLCPVGNIETADDRVVFKDNCVACLGCYHRCPNKAIKFAKFNKQFRYFCPLADEGELGK